MGGAVRLQRLLVPGAPWGSRAPPCGLWLKDVKGDGGKSMKIHGAFSGRWMIHECFLHLLRADLEAMKREHLEYSQY